MWLLCVGESASQGATTINIDGSSLLTQAAADGLSSGFGFAFDHRPYEGAEGLGARSFNLGVEATLMKVPPGLGTGLDALFSAFGSTSSIGSTLSALPFLGMLKGHFHVGVTSKFDIGASGIWLPTLAGLPSLTIIGGDIKYAVFVPEEGPVVSIRLGFNYLSFGLTQSSMTITVNSYMWYPAILIGKKFSVFEPYIGGGWQLNYGNLATVLTSADTPVAGFTTVISGSRNAGLTSGFTGFGGLKFNFFVQMAIEAAYSQQGATYFGLKVSFGL